VELGSNVGSIGTGAKRSLSLKCKDTFQYIPLLKGLQALLQNQDIRDEVSGSYCVVYYMAARAGTV